MWCGRLFTACGDARDTSGDGDLDRGHAALFVTSRRSSLSLLSSSLSRFCSRFVTRAYGDVITGLRRSDVIVIFTGLRDLDRDRLMTLSDLEMRSSMEKGVRLLSMFEKTIVIFSQSEKVPKIPRL